MPKPVSKKKVFKKKFRGGPTGNARRAPPPYSKLDRGTLMPYSEEGSTLTVEEMELSKAIKTEVRPHNVQLRFVQGGAAGTKG